MLQKVKNLYHLLQALYANLNEDFPSRELKVIGVTGTDGKTTTTSLIYHILVSSGKKASMVSSVYAKVGDTEYDTGFHVTSPNPANVQKYLRKSVESGDEYFVLETTSHGLDQNRVWGVSYEVSVLTNVTHEHLDYHKSYEKYVKTKSKLLKMSRTAIINADDSSYKIMNSLLKKTPKTYSLKQKADYSLLLSQVLNINLPEFNEYNYLAAFAVCRELGLEEKEIFTAMKTFTLPAGRVDIVLESPITAIVDFAHTPNSIEKILPYVRKRYLKDGGRLIHVFGSAARRDVSKRPIMGRASGASSDLTILTEEDYRDEDPEKICQEIGAGLVNVGFERIEAEKFGRESKKFTVIIDRASAVKKAFEVSKPGDVLIFTGKGHEKSLCRGKTEYPWDDRKAVINEAAARYPVKS